jgi:hypothetical protein
MLKPRGGSRRARLPSGNVHRPPLRYMRGHERFEQTTVIRNLQMKELVDDNEILKFFPYIIKVDC